MIKLENISTNQFIKQNKETWGMLYWNAYQILVDNNIRDYQQLKDFLESNNQALEISGIRYYFNNELRKMEQRIKRANEKEIEPKIFTFNSYQAKELDDKTINITDERNKGKVLLTSNPLILHSGIENIRKLSIAELKHYLSHLDSYKFSNEALQIPKIGSKQIQLIVDAIRFYDEQIIRQAFETEEKNINLFFLNKKAKNEMVEAQLKSIAEYLVDNAQLCVWGNLTPTQKKKIISLALTNNDKKTRGSLINAISNYTTLSELENGILKEQEIPTVIDGVIKRTKTKPIDRFIVR